MTPKIKQLGSELKDAIETSNSKFEFKAPSKTIKSNKNTKKAHKFLGDTRDSKLQIKIPKEGLPINGTLFVDGDERYLAILDCDHIEQGKKDAKRLKATLCASREVLE